MNITLHPPRANGRRSYGVQFWVNGTPVEKPTEVKSGDRVAWRYLGGNISQGPDVGAGWRALGRAGMPNTGKEGVWLIP